MILKQLRDDYERILGYGVATTDDDEDDAPDLAPPSMYEEKPVRWQISLRPNGRFSKFEPLLGGSEDKKKDRGKPLPVPFIKRTVNISPLLMADTPAYVLGVTIEKEDKNTVRKHAAFKALTKRCGEETDNQAAQAVGAFLDWWDATPEAERPALPADMTDNDTIVFDVGGEWPIDDTDVQAFWAQVCSSNAKTSAATQCLVCGEHRPAVESMPVAVKGIPNGQTSGTALVSANSDVFESYGMKRAATSPICANCAERFGKSLNLLLKGRSTHRRVGSLVYVFWTAKGVSEAAKQLSDPTPDFVGALLNAARDAEPRFVDPTAFYALVLSATAARAVVRDWLTTTVGRVNENIKRWFQMQKVPDPFGQTGKLLPDWWLAASLYRSDSGRPNTKDIETSIMQHLVRTALHGDPLPDDLLHRAVLRNRAENNVTYERAALMQLVFESQKIDMPNNTQEKEEQTVAQDAESNPPGEQNEQDMRDEQAKRCGRLLAVLEEVQTSFARANNRKINATLVDRYFGTASSAPATVFGTLLANTQDHLTNLRKTSPGAHVRLQRKMETALEGLDNFPTTLTLRRQALFSLGYYHERAEIRSEAMRKRAERNATQDKTGNITATNDTNDNDNEEINLFAEEDSTDE